MDRIKTFFRNLIVDDHEVYKLKREIYRLKQENDQLRREKYDLIERLAMISRLLESMQKLEKAKRRLSA